ncbi:MAG: RsmF rRNA methyltransferase first C-terminal domain-containing protein [Lachnospiraceae bacterium]|nr:RsmF rRNA methyltransferase first C-terminal domain-containing protein [Lachnospiraceae bacterium]
MKKTKKTCISTDRSSSKQDLPAEFLERMKDLLGDEYEDFLLSLNEPEYKALRFNPLKAEEAQLLAFINEMEGCRDCAVSIEREPVKWEKRGFYYSVPDAGPAGSPVRGPGLHPLHEAGAYYIQEPSAMKPVTLMDIGPGETVLDLCAAPGGKSTQIASALMGSGLLVSNEYIQKRAAILSSNIERMGITNAVVINESPEKIGSAFADFFDKILVDAPCSGEGMFRRSATAVSEWSVDNVHMCALRQRAILDEAVNALKPGGRLVYSTCTFELDEDEGLIKGFLEDHPELKLVIKEKLWPHKVRGEGHFMAVLDKAGNAHDGYNVRTGRPVTLDDVLCGKIKKFPGNTDLAGFNVFFEENLRPDCRLGGDGYLTVFGSRLYLVPPQMTDLRGLKVLRPGLELGTFLKGRFEPAHALAMALSPDDTVNSLSLSYDEAKAYLSGLTIPCRGANGWYLICYDGISMGWGKLSGNIMKNHYPRALRRNL